MWLIHAEVVVTVVMMLSSGSDSKHQTTTTGLSPDDTDFINILPTGNATNVTNQTEPMPIPHVSSSGNARNVTNQTEPMPIPHVSSSDLLAAPSGQQHVAENGKPCIAYDGVPAVCGYYGYPFIWCYTSKTNYRGRWDKCTASIDMKDSVGLIGDSYVIRFPDLPQGWKKITKWGDPKYAREFVEKDMVSKILSDSARPKKVWIVIILGGNDIPYQTDSKIVQDLYSIAVGFKNHGLTPFICEVNTITYPSTMTAAEYKNRTNNINSGLKDTFIAKNWEYDVVVNLPDIEIGEDGVHPTDKGFKDLKQAIITHMAKYFMQKIISWS